MTKIEKYGKKEQRKTKVKKENIEKVFSIVNGSNKKKTKEVAIDLKKLRL